MWLDDLQPGTPWSSLWKGYFICGNCPGIRRYQESCPGCGASAPTMETRVVTCEDGRTERVLIPLMGAEGRYEDWVYLAMMEREWRRPLVDDESHAQGTSLRAALVLVFWSYFETRIDRLLRAGLRDIPERMREDSLRRYAFIGARLNQFYRVVFDSRYNDDLVALGYSGVAAHLATVQERRNRFVHGEPRAIDDALVEAVVEMLKDEHESWIAVFNRRVATRAARG